MSQIILLGLAVIFPWLVLLLEDRPGAAVIALIMQTTLIGWPFATLWAWGIVRESHKPDSKNKKRPA